MYLIYNLMLWLASPLLIHWLGYRALRGRLAGLGQRLGFVPSVSASGPLAYGRGSDCERGSDMPCVWFHAVSLGEVKAAGALIEELRSRIPGVRIVMTTSTRTGWEAARRRLAPGDSVPFPPLDLPWVCRRFLRRIQPNALVVLETELWPNLFREARRCGIPLVVANGRISDKAFPRYRASRFLWRRVLSLPDVLFVQTARDAERFLALGAPPEKVRLAGNLKFALRPAPAPIVETLRAMIRASGAGPVLVAGSTMPGEETYLLETFRELAQEFPRLWMILAPRHPERFLPVTEEVHRMGIPLQLRSALQARAIPSLPGVLLLDTIGELGDVYQLATVAFVGGTLAPTGGHNVLEPAYFGRPIVIGPSMNNFQEIANTFLEDRGVGQIPGVAGVRTGAIAQVQDAGSLAATLRFLFRNPEFGRRLGEAAQELVRKNASGVSTVAEELEKLLAGQDPSFAKNHSNLAQAIVGAGELK
ncbi:MAG: 3-deoxy-D-manno-octulosonic acid transferase [Acidobacteria bacterium]|nr:3-deoxy-D-manno-octulosonic acid transferase [Acidobacteriota bacterium]